MLLPRKLEPGDRVRLVSPAHCPGRPSPDHEIEVLTDWGLTMEINEHALDRSTDDQDLAELNSALRDPGVRVVITTPGDSAAYRIADQLDVDAARRDPKPVVGIGGITHLHLALWRECGLAALYGTLTDDATEGSTEALRRALMTTGPVTMHRRSDEISTVVVPGRATGVLIGGNLSAIRSTIGVGLPSLEGAILLQDDRRTIGLGQVDRQLTHLRRLIDRVPRHHRAPRHERGHPHHRTGVR